MGTRPRSQDYHRSDPVAATLKVMLGSASEGAAHQAELGIRSKGRTLMHAYRSAGSVERGHRWLAELRASLDDRTLALTGDLMARAEQADSDEAESQLAYLIRPCPETARRWRVSLETESQIHYDLIIALRLIEVDHA